MIILVLVLVSVLSVLSFSTLKDDAQPHLLPTQPLLATLEQSTLLMETTALLQHDDSPTAILAKKLRTLLQFQALQQGYLPTNEQIQEHLSFGARSTLLDTSQRGLSKQSKHVLSDVKALLKALQSFVQDKNDGDLVQDIIWYLKRASVENELDGDIFAARLDLTKAKADAKTANMKAKAVADVLYSNPQFRALLHDGSILARDLISDVVEATATAIAPEESDLIELEQEAVDVDGRAIKDDVEETKEQIREGIETTKQKIREKYDEATSQAIETLQEAQAEGLKFAENAKETVQAKAQELGEQGKEIAAEAAEYAQQSISAALAKIEELTGIDTAEIRKQLDEGISVEDLLQKARFAAQKTADSTKQGLQDADQAAGKLLNQARDAGNEALKSGQETAKDVKKAASQADQKAGRALSDAKGKAQETAKDLDAKVTPKVSEAADSAKKTAQSAASQAKDKASAVADSAKETGKSAKDEAKNKASQAADSAKETGNAVQDEAKGTASEAADSAKETGKAAKDEAKDKPSAAKDASASKSSQSQANSGSASNHLKQIGIVHTDEDGARLQEIGVVHPDPKYMFDEEPSSSQYDSILPEIVKAIQGRVQNASEMSLADLETAARSYISSAAEKTKNAADASGDAAKSAKESGSKAADQTSDAAKEATAKGEELAEAGKQGVNKAKKAAKDTGSKAAAKADEAASQGKSAASDATSKAKSALEEGSAQASDLAQKGKETAEDTATEMQSIASQIIDEIQNTSAKDIQNQVQDYLKAAKAKAEEVTGVTEKDVKKTAQDVSDKARDMSNEAVEKGQAGLQDLKEQSADVAAATKEKATEAGKQIEAGAVTVAAQAKHTLQNAERGAAGQIHETLDASQALVDNTIAAIDEATVDIRQYLTEKFPPERREAIMKHFRGLAVSLRDNTDYSNGLDGLISIGRKYVDYTMTFVEEVPGEASDAVSTNHELDQAVRLTLQLIERFTGGVGFDGVQKAYVKLKSDMSKEKNSGDFLDDCMTFFKKIVQDMKYAASSDAEKHGQELLNRINDFSEDTGFKQDINTLIREVVRVAEGFASDKATLRVYDRGQSLVKHLCMNERGNFVFKKRLLKDFFNVLLPSALQIVQYIPISRIEFQDADVDLLIENLVFESSASHDQSFLPYKLRVENNNVVEFLNAYKFESDYSNQLTIKMEGLTLAVRDAGFYIRKKTGFFRFTDTGLLDLLMDGKGIDIEIDVQMSTEDEEADVTKDALFIVKDVRVTIHKFDFSTSGAKHGWLIGLLKPFIRGFVKRQIGLAVAGALTEQLEFYEYQLRMFKHRIKTAYIANNGQASFNSFFRAVFTANAGTASGRKGQFEVSIGKPGPLAGIHTKASLAKELEYSDEIVDEEGHGPRSWRNDIFDVTA